MATTKKRRIGRRLSQQKPGPRSDLGAGTAEAKRYAYRCRAASWAIVSSSFTEL